MYIVSLLFALLFVALGIVFLCGKGAWLVAGYNTSSPAKKARVDEKKLLRFMGKLMFALAASIIVISAGDIFKTMTLVWVGIGLFFASAIGGVVYMSTGRRFEKR